MLKLVLEAHGTEMLSGGWFATFVAATLATSFGLSGVFANPSMLSRPPAP